MALAEYIAVTVPDVVKKRVPSFYHRDPYLGQLFKQGMVKRSGGPNVRFLRIKGGHTDTTEIDNANFTVNIVGDPIYSTMTGDWAKHIAPIVFKHTDRDRMNSPDQVKAWVKDTSEASMTRLHNRLMRQVYIGNVTKFRTIGTLNGNVTGLPTSGLQNGALRFETKAAQVAAGITYLNETRVFETTGDQEDNFVNHFEAHNGLAVDGLDVIQRLKTEADTYSPEGEISVGIGSIFDCNALDQAVRFGGGTGQPVLTYTPADVESGKAHRPITVVAGISFHSNRYITASTWGTEAFMLLNPKSTEYWVNAGNDFKTLPPRDMLATAGIDADVGFIVIEVQVGCPGLLWNATTKHA
jgi:hypothetical protein